MALNATVEVRRLLTAIFRTTGATLRVLSPSPKIINIKYAEHLGFDDHCYSHMGHMPGHVLFKPSGLVASPIHRSQSSLLHEQLIKECLARPQGVQHATLLMTVDNGCRARKTRWRSWLLRRSKFTSCWRRPSARCALLRGTNPEIL